MSQVRRFATLAVVLAAAGLATGCSSEIKIGAVISETGAVATYGQQVRKGLDLALAEVNAAGGFRGRPIAVLYRDDATMPDRGEQVVRELIDNDGVDMIIGAVSSKVTVKIAPICEKEGVVLLSPTASTPEISAFGDFVFRNYPSDILEGTSMARFAKDQGFERVVIFALDDEFGRGLTEVFRKEYESKFREVVKTFLIPVDQSSGFRAMVDETKALDPDGIWIITYDEALESLLQDMHAVGLRAVRMGTSSVPQAIGQTLGPAAEKLVYPRSGFDLQATDPAVVSFIQAFRAKYGNEDPDIYAAHGYDALKLFVAAMENAGGVLHPDNLKIGMSAIKGFQGAAGLTTFDKNGDVVRYPRLFIVHEGRSIPFDKFAEQGLTLLAGKP